MCFFSAATSAALRVDGRAAGRRAGLGAGRRSLLRSAFSDRPQMHRLRLFGEEKIKKTHSLMPHRYYFWQDLDVFAQDDRR